MGEFMELIKLTENTYYIENNTNIGIYKIDNNNVYLIDTGNDKDAGKKILKIIEEQNWNILGIINTHSHADHTGGNKIIQNRTNAKIYCSKIEKDIINNPKEEPALLYGSNPFNNLRNKFLEADSSICDDLIDIDGLEIINLKGHSPNMIGITTNTGVSFIGDSLASKDVINKYHIFYLYNLKDYLSTLEYLSTLKSDIYILSHNEPLKDLTELIKINKDKIDEIINVILSLLKENLTFDNLLEKIFTHYKLTMNTNQFFLVGSTIKSYLTFLIDENKITYEFINNKMYYKKL